MRLVFTRRFEEKALRTTEIGKIEEIGKIGMIGTMNN